MEYLLLALVVFTAGIQSVFVKEYGNRVPNTPITYSALTCLFSMLVFIITSKLVFSFKLSVFLFSVAFAVVYSMATLGLTIAINSGPLSITSLVNSYSLIIPALYGIIFAKEEIKLTLCVGLVLLFISLYLVNYVKGDNEGKKVSLKWVIASAVAFIGNGMCSTVQTAQQKTFEGQYKNEFMIMALFISTIILFAAALFVKKENKAVAIKKGWYWALLRGVANGITNLLVIILVNSVPSSIMFPVISGGGIVFASAMSIFVYKEKLTKIQTVGLIIGIASIIFLNM